MQEQALCGPKDYLTPRNETEQKIAQIWEKTLNLQSVGMRENFVDLGGDSLHAIRVMNNIRSLWSIELSIEQLLEHPTVESLARIVDEMAGASRHNAAGSPSDAAKTTQVGSPPPGPIPGQ